MYRGGAFGGARGDHGTERHGKMEGSWVRGVDIRRTGGDRQKSNEKVPREDSKGVLFLLLVPDFEVRRVPCPQNVPGSRSCFDGR